MNVEEAVTIAESNEWPDVTRLRTAAKVLAKRVNELEDIFIIGGDVRYRMEQLVAASRIIADNSRRLDELLDESTLGSRNDHTNS